MGTALSLTQTGTNDGTIDWDFTVANSLVQYLADGETVTAVYTITVSDDSGTGNDTATHDVTVVITGSNDEPTITVVDVTGAGDVVSATLALALSAVGRMLGCCIPPLVSRLGSSLRTSTRAPMGSTYSNVFFRFLPIGHLARASFSPHFSPAVGGGLSLAVGPFGQSALCYFKKSSLQ